MLGPDKLGNIEGYAAPRDFQAPGEASCSLPITQRKGRL